MRVIQNSFAQPRLVFEGEARARIVERYSLETLLRDSKAALKALCAGRGTR
jgi:hypothetical protein